MRPSRNIIPTISNKKTYILIIIIIINIHTYNPPPSPLLSTYIFLRLFLLVPCPRVPFKNLLQVYFIYLLFRYTCKSQLLLPLSPHWITLS